MKNFEGFMRKFANQNHVEVQWQQLRFGYKRAKIPCHSWAEYTAVEAALRRINPFVWNTGSASMVSLKRTFTSCRWRITPSSKQNPKLSRISWRTGGSDTTMQMQKPVA